jgi:hypothetical protein
MRKKSKSQDLQAIFKSFKKQNQGSLALVLLFLHLLVSLIHNSQKNGEAFFI